MDVAWKRAFDAGQYVGPRLFACGHFLTTTGGHFLTSGHARECDGPYGFVRAIREQIKNGVDHIKLNLTGGIMGPAWDRHWQSFLLDDELEAAFAICRKRGFPVMAHAASPEAVQAAARLGAHSVEHGYIMDADERGEPARERDMVRSHPRHLAPHAGSGFRSVGEALGRRAESRRRPVSPRRSGRGTHRACFQQALAAGVKMALGSDIRPLKDAALLELGSGVRAGRHTVAGPAGRHPSCRGALRRGPGPWHHRAWQARRSDRRRG
jgi:imidazolonepropionase-like amidohydrolase